jgi:hypothetical protein
MGHGRFYPASPSSHLRLLHHNTTRAGEAAAPDVTPARVSPTYGQRSSSSLGFAANNVFKGGAVREEAIVGTASSLGLGESRSQHFSVSSSSDACWASAGYGLAVGTILGQGSTVKRLGRALPSARMSVGDWPRDPSPWRCSVKDGDGRGHGKGDGSVERQTRSSAGVIEESKTGNAGPNKTSSSCGDYVADIVRRQSISFTKDAGDWQQLVHWPGVRSKRLWPKQPRAPSCIFSGDRKLC